MSGYDMLYQVMSCCFQLDHVGTGYYRLLLVTTY